MTTDQKERLAALEHEQWAHWTRYMLDKIWHELASNWDLKVGDTHVCRIFSDLACVQHWRRQIDTPYEDLSEREKTSDREWAERVMQIK